MVHAREKGGLKGKMSSRNGTNKHTHYCTVKQQKKDA
jgi:hypothetical protein